MRRRRKWEQCVNPSRNVTVPTSYRNLIHRHSLTDIFPSPCSSHRRLYPWQDLARTLQRVTWRVHTQHLLPVSSRATIMKPHDPAHRLKQSSKQNLGKYPISQLVPGESDTRLSFAPLGREEFHAESTPLTYELSVVPMHGSLQYVSAKLASFSGKFKEKCIYPISRLKCPSRRGLFPQDDPVHQVP